MKEDYRMNKKSTKRSLLFSVLALILCCSLLAGTTLAWFTDTASSGVNKIQAGNLDIALEMKDDNGNWVTAEGKTLQFKVNGQIPPEGTQILWEPGCTYELPELKITNNGNLKLKYKIVISGIGGDVGLNEVINWKMTVKDSGSSEITKELTADHPLEAGAYNTLIISGHMREDAGNEYQGMSIDNIAITVAATQLGGDLDGVIGEFDSIDNEYDKNATYPPLASYINNTTEGIVTAAEPEQVSGTKVVYAPLRLADTKASSSFANTTKMYSGDEEDTLITIQADEVPGKLVRNIETKNATANSVTYDISFKYVAANGNSTPVVKFGNIVENVIEDVSTGLENVKVTHSHEGADPVTMNRVDAMPGEGEQVQDNTFYYDGENGRIYVWSQKYSSFIVEFTSNFGASVNGQGYGTLEQAVAAAKAGDVVCLLKDAELTGNGIAVSADKDFLLDGLGKTITFAHTAFNAVDENNLEGLKAGKLNVKNTNFVSKSAGYAVCLGFNSTAKVAFDGCTFENMYTVVYSNPRTEASEEKAVISIQNCQYKNTTWGYSVDNATEGSLAKISDQVTVTFTNNTGLAEGHDREMFNWTSRATSVPDAVNNVITITTPEQLAALAVSVNNGNNYSGKTVQLGADIDLADCDWTPIGKYGKPFQGKFEGQNHIISNLTVNMPGQSDVGLFGLTTNGSVSNLIVENAEVTGYLDVGVVSGTPYTSTYSNITVRGDVKVNGFSYVGGLFGKNLYANATHLVLDANAGSYVKANSQGYRTYVGGIVGFMGEGRLTVSDVQSNIDVYGSTCDVGGITGIAHYNNNFVDVSCSGNVYITSYNDDGDQLEIGGIAGVWHDETGTTVTFTRCTFAGKVQATHSNGQAYTGGFEHNDLIGRKYGSGTGTLIIDGNKYNT